MNAAVLARRLTLLSAIALFLSLFLPWSHQFSAAVLARPGAATLFAHIPRDPTAWQVYSAADVLLALLAPALVASCGSPSTRVRIAAIVVTALALSFTFHALSAPPTNGADIVNPASSPPSYYRSSASAGAGETMAILALLTALAGLTLSLVADRRQRADGPRRVRARRPQARPPRQRPADAGTTPAPAAATAPAPILDGDVHNAS